MQVIDLFRVKPIDASLKDLIVGRAVFTAENHNRIGGIGSAICELLAEDGNTPVHRISVDESFGQVGQQAYLMEVYGLTAQAIVKKMEEKIQK